MRTIDSGTWFYIHESFRWIGRMSVVKGGDSAAIPTRMID